MAEQWMEERSATVAKCIRREETAKVPYLMVADQYIAEYYGVDKGAIKTFDEAAQLSAKFAAEIRMDTMVGGFEPVNLTAGAKREILGGGTMIVKNNTKMQLPNAVDILGPEEYPELIKNPARYLLGTVYPRRYELLKKDAATQMEGFAKMLGWQKQLGEYDENCISRGAHIFANGTIVFPVDAIFDLFREFKGISSDIKRCPELLRDAGLAIAEQMKPVIDLFTPCADRAIFIPMHLPAFMRPKEFEKIYWPSFKMLADYMAGRGLNVLYYFEKSYAHLLDYLQDLPKTGVIGLFQEDDRRVVKQKLGGRMAIAGWLKTSLMGSGTKEQCVDYVKELIQDMAPGGGYFIAPDAPMMFPYDAKPENLKAVSDFIFEHRA